jgi:AraC-like DNA-binding protein
VISAIGERIDMLPQQLPPARFYELIGQLLATPSAGLIWLLAMSLLDDDFRLDLKGILVVIVSSAIPMMYFLSHVDVLPYTSLFYWHFHMPILVCIVLHVVWVGFKDDLINVRRQARVWLIALPTSLLLIGVIAEYTVDEQTQVVVYLIAEFIGVSSLFFLLTNHHHDFLNFSSPNEANTEEPENNQPSVGYKDKAAFDRLMVLMDNDKIFLDAELTVNTLADKVGIPAHQLRVIINQGMGYKNFSSFLGKYRIEHVKAALIDPEQARTPILSIALNSGFSSLATFNRLFKLEVGLAAGEYRKRALINDSQ